MSLSPLVSGSCYINKLTTEEIITTNINGVPAVDIINEIQASRSLLNYISLSDAISLPNLTLSNTFFLNTYAILYKAPGTTTLNLTNPDGITGFIDGKLYNIVFTLYFTDITVGNTITTEITSSLKTITIENTIYALNLTRFYTFNTYFKAGANEKIQSIKITRSPNTNNFDAINYIFVQEIN